MFPSTAGIFRASEAGHNSLEPPNLISLLHGHFSDHAVIQFLFKFENIVFAALAGVLLSILFIAGARKMSLVPGRLQNVLELVVETLQDFFVGILGPHGKHFVPFVGTLFLYIWCMNMMGLIPFLKSSTTDLNLTLALALCVFGVVQATAIFKLGPLTYLDHLAGQPRDLTMWLLVPLLLPLFIILDVLVPPVTLSLRLFGNISGEDTLFGAFLNLATDNLFEPSGIGSFIGGLLAFLTTVILRFLSILLGSIQALVFSLLATIYILMVLPHEEPAH